LSWKIRDEFIPFWAPPDKPYDEHATAETTVTSSFMPEQIGQWWDVLVDEEADGSPECEDTKSETRVL